MGTPKTPGHLAPTRTHVGVLHCSSYWIGNQVWQHWHIATPSHAVCSQLASDTLTSTARKNKDCCIPPWVTASGPRDNSRTHMLKTATFPWQLHCVQVFATFLSKVVSNIKFRTSSFITSKHYCSCLSPGSSGAVLRGRLSINRLPTIFWHVHIFSLCHLLQQGPTCQLSTHKIWQGQLLYQPLKNIRQILSWITCYELGRKQFCGFVQDLVTHCLLTKTFSAYVNDCLSVLRQFVSMNFCVLRILLWMMSSLFSRVLQRFISMTFWIFRWCNSLCQLFSIVV